MPALQIDARRRHFSVGARLAQREQLAAGQLFEVKTLAIARDPVGDAQATVAVRTELCAPRVVIGTRSVELYGLAGCLVHLLSDVHVDHVHVDGERVRAWYKPRAHRTLVLARGPELCDFPEGLASRYVVQKAGEFPGVGVLLGVGDIPGWQLMPNEQFLSVASDEAVGSRDSLSR